MHKLMSDIKKELKQIEEKGLNASNLGAVGQMVDILKDIKEINEMEGKEMRDYRYGGNYGREDYAYNEGDNYNEGGNYNEGRGGYGARMRDSRGRYMEGNYGRGGNFINIDPRMMDRLDRIMEGAEMYDYGRQRYRGGDNKERMHDGLEKMMYAVCTFIESTMDFAETPEEKEIIRKHIQKLAKI